MARTDLAEKLRQLAAPLAAGLGLDIWGMELPFGQRAVLRIFVESREAGGSDPAQGGEAAGQPVPAVPAGVSIDQCASFSRLLGLALDVEDLIPGAYVLEVSSPGLERSFFTPAQLAGAVGQVIEVTLQRAPEDRPERRRFRGTLTAAPPAGEADGPEALFTVRLEDEAAPLRFAFADLQKARQVHVVPEKALPGKGGKKKDKHTGAAGKPSGGAEQP